MDRGNWVMRRKLSISTLAAAALLLCASLADAQRMRTRVVSAPAGTQVIRASGASASHSSGAASAPVVTQHSRNSVEGLLLGDYPVPGLGFDYTHLAAVNRNLGTRALIDPVTQRRLALERDLRRNAPRPVAPAFPVVVNQIVVNVAPQPPVVIVQEPEPEPEYERIERASYAGRLERLERREGLGVSSPQGAAVPFYEPPLRETDDLVLIRRDGALLFAVAFTVQPDTAGDARLVYITREGHRRSLPLAELDLDATRDINEARGTSLHLR
jgi:hypothetical protein